MKRLGRMLTIVCMLAMFGITSWFRRRERDGVQTGTL